MQPLPIDRYTSEIAAKLKTERSLVISAPPGAGKTTRVPRALYDAGFAESGEIVILEPRRLAARLSAQRVAQEFGEAVGGTVGYSIRFETVGGAGTRIRFLTEAILARQLVHDPNLKKISTVILDEFHERHLANDLALAFLKRLQTTRLDLKIVVMSATLDVTPICSFLNAFPLSISGSPFGITIEYEERASDRPLHEKIVHAVSKLFRSGCRGDILVFLPGSYEIRKAAEALEGPAGRLGILVLPLHGDLPASEQKRALEPAQRQKVILATNVAETSLTIPGVAAVIDSGLARIAGHSPWSGFPTLSTAKISRSSAVQRAGRAGRTQDGYVIRLYTRADFESRPEFETPEIKRVDLAETALLLHGCGVPDLQSFPWFESPAVSGIEAAETLLHKLGAIDSFGHVTKDGSRMLQMPIHPRLARLIIEGIRQNHEDDSILLASLLSERDIYLNARARLSEKTVGTYTGAAAESDLLERIEFFRKAEEEGFEKGRLEARNLDSAAVQAVRKAYHQLLRICSAKAAKSSELSPKEAPGLLAAILAAFPDRVFRRRKPNSRELIMAGGGSAVLSQSSVVHNPIFGVAVDAEERRDSSRKDAAVTVRLASSIDIDWLAALFPEDLQEKTELIWREKSGRVEESRSTSYGQITLEEKILPARPSDAVTRILEAALWAHQLSDFSDAEALPELQARLSLLAQCFPGEKFILPDESELRELVHSICIGKTCLDQLSGTSLSYALLQKLTGHQRALFNREVPERIKLKAGRNVKIHYENSKPPWIESRLQDFFGMSETPSICGSRIALTLHLLAPNGRAVQVTSDLGGFWKKHYPAIRKELQRRYPKHSWPERPVPGA